MCGIAGFVGPGDAMDLAAMTEAVRHRGPDGEGSYVDHKARVFLGHRRLAIVDLAGGAQPMWNEDDSVCVVSNGEIYNHAELRGELIRRGHVFRTDHSDTEVLVHGYEEWGDGLPRRLNGMFAFAIYDARRRRLFLARDRFGEKPLYWAKQGGLFAFASELSALASHRTFIAEADPRAVQKFFAHGFFPAPNALYRSSFKLPAGSMMEVDVATGETSVRSYWRFALEPDESLDERAEPRLVDELRGHLDRAVSRRLMSDVPLGIMLSGGIDSSAALAFAARHRAGPEIETFCIGFEDPSFDESAYARMVARAFRTRHHERRLSYRDAQSLVPAVLSRLDEPQGDPSIIPTHLLCAFARERVTVALSGDGGDELFAGYDTFDALGAAQLYAKIVPEPIHRLLRRAVSWLPVSERNMSLDFKLRRALAGLSYPMPLWNPVWLALIEPAAMSAFFDRPLPPEELYAEVLEAWHGSAVRDLLGRTLEFYTRFYLQDGILAKVDRASMMVSLESRAIFLDNDLVDFSRRLPGRFKYRDGQKKYLLKKALAGMVPDSVLTRAKKGFGIPLVSWLRRMPPPSVGAAMVRAGIKADRMEAALHEHGRGQRDHRLLFWGCLALDECLSREAGARKVGT
jgi:asparagine synthase (glutamine-hydrolysing)